MRGAKRKARDADKVLRELGYRFADAPVHSARPPAGEPEASPGTGGRVELGSPGPDDETEVTE